jgi:hypothetical protein
MTVDRHVLFEVLPRQSCFGHVMQRYPLDELQLPTEICTQVSSFKNATLLLELELVYFLPYTMPARLLVAAVLLQVLSSNLQPTFPSDKEMGAQQQGHRFFQKELVRPLLHQHWTGFLRFRAHRMNRQQAHLFSQNVDEKVLLCQV